MLIFRLNWIMSDVPNSKMMNTSKLYSQGREKLFGFMHKISESNSNLKMMTDIGRGLGFHIPNHLVLKQKYTL